MSTTEQYIENIAKGVFPDYTGNIIYVDSMEDIVKSKSRDYVLIAIPSPEHDRFYVYVFFIGRRKKLFSKPKFYSGVIIVDYERAEDEMIRYHMVLSSICSVLRQKLKPKREMIIVFASPHDKFGVDAFDYVR